MLIDQILEQKKSALRANDIARVLDLSEKPVSYTHLTLPTN